MRLLRDGQRPSRDDLVNCVKQAQEFGLTRSGVKLAAIIGSVTGVLAAGMNTMQGMFISETFYWDQDERTRAFTKRVQAKLPAGVFPNYVHAGNYSGVLHYLKAVKELGVGAAKSSGRAAVAAMKRMPTDDDAYGVGRVREDGRKIHPVYLFEVKAPGEVKAEWDLYRLAGTIEAEEAMRPLAEGGCPLVRG